MNEGLEGAGIDLGRFRACRTTVNKIAEIQFIRFDDLPVVIGTR